MADAPASTSPAPASPATPPPAAVPPERKVAPIPDKKTGDTPAGDRPRDESGRFTKGGESTTTLGELLDSMGGEADEYDRAKTDLDGRDNPRIIIKSTPKNRAKDALIAPAPEGAEGAIEPVVEGAVAEPPEGAEVATEEETPTTAPIVIAGKQYRDLAHVEQSVKSLQGMYNSEIKRSADRKYVGEANFSSAMAWKARAEANEARIAELEGRAPTQEGTASGTQGNAGLQATAAKVASSTGATKESILKSVDWETFEQIRQKGGETTATLWAVEQMLNQVTSGYDKRLEEMTKPAKETAEKQAEGEAIGQTMRDMEQWVYEGTDSPIFPELSDEEATIEIGQVVIRMHQDGLPLSYFKTAKGINQAILTWRDWRNRTKRPWSRPNAGQTDTPTVVDPVAAATASVARANAGAVVPRGTAPTRRAPASAAMGANLVNDIIESNKPTEHGWAR